MAHDQAPASSVNELAPTAADVTTEQAVTRELEESRDFITAILDTVAALIIVLDRDGRIERFNGACERVTGLRAEDVVGQSVFDILIPADEQVDVQEVFAALLSQDEPVDFENDWLTADGKRRTISWANTRLTNPDGTVRAVVGMGIDVTEQRVLEARMAQSDRLDSIGRLASGIAHDFNNTLAVLKLRVGRLGERHVDAESQADVQAIDRTIDHTQNLIGDLLAFSRGREMKPTAIDVNERTRRTMEMLDDILGDRVTVELDLTDERPFVIVDPVRFDQVVTNLTINARDAMPEGGTVTITSAIDEIVGGNTPNGPAPPTLTDGEYVRLTVTDTGVGIRPEDQPNVFDPYFTTKPPGRGTGLGLATTYGTIAQSGGAIIVDSEPGLGTTFTLWLPRSDSKVTPSRFPEPRMPVVLVVEDDPDMRQILVDAVGDLGFETLAAADGGEALAHIEAPVGLLLADVNLPDIEGVEVARRFRERDPDLRVQYITGRPLAEIREILPPGADVLHKPFSNGDLAAALRAQFRMKGVDG